MHGFSTRETAETLDATPVQVKNWIQRGRRTLEARYARTCALVTKDGVCHQCVELDAFFNGQAGNPLEGTARNVEARLTILRSRRDASLGAWHRAMLQILDEVISSS